jgi:hypothetical protein
MFPGICLVEEKLTQFLKTGKDWGRMRTTLPGVFVLKMPAYRSSPARLAVELNPVDEAGAPTKKRGLVLRSSKELEEYKAVFKPDKLAPLLKSLDAINPSAKKVKAGEEVIEL